MEVSTWMTSLGDIADVISKQYINILSRGGELSPGFTNKREVTPRNVAARSVVVRTSSS